MKKVHKNKKFFHNFEKTLLLINIITGIRRCGKSKLLVKKVTSFKKL